MSPSSTPSSSWGLLLAVVLHQLAPQLALLLAPQLALLLLLALFCRFFTFCFFLYHPAC
jgi:hypothetical protein